MSLPGAGPGLVGVAAGRAVAVGVPASASLFYPFSTGPGSALTVDGDTPLSASVPTPAPSAGHLGLPWASGLPVSCGPLCQQGLSPGGSPPGPRCCSLTLIPLRCTCPGPGCLSPFAGPGSPANVGRFPLGRGRGQVGAHQPELGSRLPLQGRAGHGVAWVLVGAGAWPPHSPWLLPCRGSHPRGLQDQNGHLRDTSESGRPHVCQLPDLAPVRGGEALCGLLQHQQRQVPAFPRPPPECQGEPRGRPAAGDLLESRGHACSLGHTARLWVQSGGRQSRDWGLVGCQGGEGSGGGVWLPSTPTAHSLPREVAAGKGREESSLRTRCSCTAWCPLRAPCHGVRVCPWSASPEGPSRGCLALRGRKANPSPRSRKPCSARRPPGSALGSLSQAGCRPW